jgi:hypothetical protein
MEEKRLDELHAKLDLKPDQEPAWQALVAGLQAARPNPNGHDRPDGEMMKMETTPQRLDQMLAGLDDMRGHLMTLDQSVKTFYAGLSKDQQTIFDDNFRRLRPHPGRPGGWERGLGHGPMGHGPMDRPAMGPPPQG